MSHLREYASSICHGHIRIYEREDPKHVIFEDHNVIVNTAKAMFARLMFANVDHLDAFYPAALYGVWGLCLGSGNPTWAPNTQPAADPTQVAVVSPILRKPLTSVSFLDVYGNPSTVISETVSFQTALNATTDGFHATAIREMGLIGGGSPNSTGHTGPRYTVSAGQVVDNWVPTDMRTADWWDPATRNPNSITLVNYKTMAPLILPAGITFVLDWNLTF